MKVRHAVVALLSGALFLPLTAPAHAAGRTPSGTSGGSTCSAGYYRGDARLGPASLPVRGTVGRQLDGYTRTGFMTVPHFLARYWDPTANMNQGGWIYPPANGFVQRMDGTPVEWDQQLRTGQEIDRYGSEFGTFLAPAGTPYGERAIPPQSLEGQPAAGCDYHEYRVIKSFDVEAGPIAPWFAQTGLGLQYQVVQSLVPGSPANINVGWLLSHGYLQRVI